MSTYYKREVITDVKRFCEVVVQFDEMEDYLIKTHELWWEHDHQDWDTYEECIELAYINECLEKMILGKGINPKFTRATKIPFGFELKIKDCICEFYLLPHPDSKPTFEYKIIR